MSKTFLDTLSAELRHMQPLHGLILAHSTVVLVIVAWRGDIAATAHQWYVEQFAPLYFLALPVAYAAARLVLAALRAPGMRLPRRDLLPELLGRATGAAITFTALLLFLGSFTTFKTLMPSFWGGFPQDRFLADLDAALHGGTDPGPFLLGHLDNPLLIEALQWNYAAVWSALAFVPLFFVVLQAPRLRLRYCLSFVLVWAILGNVLACAFLSAGPAFYGAVTGDAARFGPQMQALQGTLSSAFQAYLWDIQRQNIVGFGTGISAFPSVHVGVAMMNALFLRDINRIAGFAGFVYVAIVALSSVLFGWHYAIDGYVSILVVTLLHAALKRLFGESRHATAEDGLTPSPATP